MEGTEPASAPVARTKKGRRKFDKKTAHRFTLMHRSQLDPLYDEEGASKLVLHPQNERTAEGTVYAELRHAQDREQEQREAAAAATADASSGTKHLSAVDEMGMPHDGYDYRQHIRPMGGGTFVGVDGKTRSASDVPGVAVTAPASSTQVHAVLATRETEMPQDRMFEAITLTTDEMPDDVALALDSDYDDYDYDDAQYGDGDAVDAAQGRLINGKDGVFEELQLDFIAEASAEPQDGQAPAFNFKEHIARLMRHADGQFSDDEDEEKRSRSDLSGVGEYGARDDDEEDEDGEEFDLAALGLAHLVVDEDSEEGRGGRGKRRADDAPTDVVSRPRRNIDDAFDALLEREYEDDQIGDLDEELCAEDGLAETLSGIKLDADTVGEMMDRFLLADGQKKVQLTGEALHAQLLHVKEFVETQERSRLEASTLAAHNEAEAALGVTNEEKRAGGVVEAVVDYDADDVPVLHASGKAATEKKAEIGWSREKRFLPRRLRRANEHDCESVVSTYSNLDNHPRLLGATRRDGRTTKLPRQSSEMPTAPFIKLSKKTGLPIGALGRYDDDDDDDDTDSEENEDGEENYEEGGDEYGEADVPRANLGVKRAKKETAQEKRARKKAVKAERRARRQQKKMMKTVFKKEEKRQLQGTRPSDGISITPLH